MRLIDLPTQQLGSPEDLAKKIGFNGVMHFVSIVCEAYEILYASGKIKYTMSETQITEELFIEVEGVWWDRGPKSIRPIHEKSHGRSESGRGKSPTIDFCFRDCWNMESYLGAECKLLEQDNNTRYKDYIEGGIDRYLTGRYGKKCSAGMMIGYILNGNSPMIISEVRNLVDRASCNSKMILSISINGFKEHYESVHERKLGVSPFDIHHLFFCFT